eukprot:Hpha_TRINITY_DN16345_c0_g3::TRINITY_DN16345_c0_g3_i1::g.59867::m.59867
MPTFHSYATSPVAAAVVSSSPLHLFPTLSLCQLRDGGVLQREKFKDQSRPLLCISFPPCHFVSYEVAVSCRAAALVGETGEGASPELENQLKQAVAAEAVQGERGFREA